MPADSTDPFEAFKKKKEAAKAADKAGEQSAKVLGWVEGCGPAGEADPTKPKGFVKGRFKKKDVPAADLAKIRPKKMDPTMLTKAEDRANANKEAVEDREDLPPENVRMPKKFTKF
jgi:hypothetical protein